MAKPAKQLHPHNHWHFLFHRRRSSLRRNTNEILMGQILSLGGALMAGYLLEVVKGTFATTIGVFLLLPGLIDLCGSVAGSFSAKIHHALEEHPRLLPRIFINGLLYSLAAVVVAALIVGFFAAALATLFFHASLWTVFGLAIASALITGIIALPLVGGLTIVVSRLGFNPDNIVGPVETSLVDSLAIFALYIVIKVSS